MQLPLPRQAGKRPVVTTATLQSFSTLVAGHDACSVIDVGFVLWQLKCPFSLTCILPVSSALHYQVALLAFDPPSLAAAPAVPRAEEFETRGLVAATPGVQSQFCHSPALVPSWLRRESHHGAQVRWVWVKPRLDTCQQCDPDRRLLPSVSQAPLGPRETTVGCLPRGGMERVAWRLVKHIVNTPFKTQGPQSREATEVAGERQRSAAAGQGGCSRLSSSPTLEGVCSGKLLPLHSGFSPGSDPCAVHRK